MHTLHPPARSAPENVILTRIPLKAFHVNYKYTVYGRLCQTPYLGKSSEVHVIG